MNANDWLKLVEAKEAEEQAQRDRWAMLDDPDITPEVRTPVRGLRPKLQCKRGHLQAEHGSMLVYASGRVQRYCRACNQQRQREKRRTAGKYPGGLSLGDVLA